MSNQIFIRIVEDVENAASRLLTKSSKFACATPLLNQLHWLSVYFEVHINILVLTWIALHGQTPVYISGQLHPYNPISSLRSWWGPGDSLLSKLIVKNDMTFSSVTPRLWNFLPLTLRSMDLVASFNTLKLNWNVWLYSSQWLRMPGAINAMGGLQT